LASAGALGAGSTQPTMQNREQTNTLLQAQDFLATLNYRDRTPIGAPRRRENKPRPMPHDFLVPNLRPDLTPELFASAAPATAQSWERNMPQK
jgi:hypothetical protein